MLDKTKVAQAVELLIQSPAYTKIVNEITGIVKGWDDHPMVYAGKLECLNALVDIALEDMAAFEKIVALVETKRKLIPQTRKADYQRDLMRERRARLARAIEIEEMSQGKMSREQKAERERELLAGWAEMRTEYILRKSRATKGGLTWEQRNEASREFWQMIDDALQKRLNLLRKL